MFDELRTAALLAKAVAQDATAFKAFSALHSATLAGARAMGLEDRIGSLQAGKQADIIAVDLGQLETLPLYDVISQLVYAGSRQQVTDVWIAGRNKLLNRQLVDIDIHKIQATARQWQRTIKGIQSP
jgi:5-methylthioadenosine/S-adenosylhomocysteine deaminase